MAVLDKKLAHSRRLQAYQRQRLMYLFRLWTKTKRITRIKIRRLRLIR